MRFTTRYLLPLALDLVIGALATPVAKADIDLDNIAPKLTKCWSTTCVMPAAAYNATLFNLKDKKWELGTRSVGAGVNLLFFSDTLYASGIAAHVSGVLTQETGQSSFVMPSVGLTIARYGAAMFHYRWSSDGPSVPYVSLTLNLPGDFFSVATLPVRAKAARMKAAER